MKKTFRLACLCALCFSLGAMLTAPTMLMSDNPPAHVAEEEADVVILGEEADVVILGGGIGGLTSAIYLARSGVKPIVIEGLQPGGQITQSLGIQNWPGELEITGNLLTEKARKQAEESGAIILREEAVKVDFTRSPFTVVLRNPWHPTQKKVFRTKACIIATGALPNKLNIKGESTYWSRGVHTCATCDGTLYKGQHVVVVGGGDAAIVEAHHLAKMASKVTLIIRGKTFRSIEEKRKQNLLALPNVEVLYETEVKEIVGANDKVTHLVLKSKNNQELITLPVGALFLAIGTKPNTELFRGQLDLDKQGYIILKKDQSTSVPGVYAIGDVSDPHYRQAITAAGDGAKAALQTEDFLASDNSSQPNGNSFLSVKKNLTSTRSPAKPAILQVKSESHVVSIKSIEQFNQEVLASDIPVIVDFYADWCGPCRALSPHIDEWSQQFQGQLKFAKVNVDHLQKLAKRYKVDALPTVLYFEKHGKLKDKREGHDEIAELMSQLEERVVASVP